MPLGDIAALGTGFSSLAAQLQEAQGGSSTLTAFVPTDGKGNLLEASQLYQKADGSGLLGAYHSTTGNQIVGQASWQRVDVVQSSASAMNLSMAFMALALVTVNRKLDNLQGSLDSLMRYEELRDMAELRGKLKSLMSDTRNYVYNSDNELFRNGANDLAKDTRTLAEERITFLQTRIEDELAKVSRVHTSGAVRRLLTGDKGTTGIVDELGEYQLALRAYNYAYFILVVLQQNFAPDYLASVKAELHEHDVAYRKLYARCFDEASALCLSAADSVASGVLAGAAKGLGRALSKTPVGTHTSVDGMLVGAGDALERADNAASDKLLAELRVVAGTSTADYIASLEELEAAHNGPVIVLADAENLYLLPAEGCEETLAN